MERHNSLEKRILEISYKHGLSHIGSCISTVAQIDSIFSKKSQNDIFILSCGHAAVALYVVIEKYHGICAEKLFKKHGVHPHWDESNEIYCSTGSLGLGLPIAVGRALANPTRKVYCLISDGECAEGSIWESLCFANEQNISNLEITVAINGYSAYGKVDIEYLKNRLKVFYPRIHLDTFSSKAVLKYPFLKGLNAHYHVMGEEEYEKAIQ